MYGVKQNTAITIPIFCHDADGDAVTSLSDGDFTKRISKGSGSFAALSVTLTEMEGGWYSLPLTATETNTAGILTIYLIHASIKQVNLQFRVTARITDDLAWPTVSGRSLDITSAGHAGIDLSNINGTLDVDTYFTNLNDPTAAAIADAVWDEAASGHTSAGTFGAQAGTDIDAILADTNEIQGKLPINYIMGASDQTDNDTVIDAVKAKTDNLPSDPADDSDIDTQLASISSAISGLNDLSAAEVNAEVVDVLTVDTITLLGQEAPPNTPTFAEAVGLPYKILRNKSDNTGSGDQYYADDGSTVDMKATTGESGGVVTVGEIVSGP